MSKDEIKNVSRAAGVVGFFTFLSRILGLVRDMVIACFFGSGMTTDAFFVAFRIPNLLRRLFAEGSLTIAFIPVFTEYLTAKGKKDAFELARVVLTLLTIIITVLTLLGIIFSPWIVRFQAYGFGDTGYKYELTVLLTRIIFPYIFFISIVAFFMGVLNSLRRFAAPASAPIFLNIGIIGAVFLISPHLSRPIIGVAIGVIIGGMLQVGIQIPSVLKEGFVMIPCFKFDHPGIKRIGMLMLPAIFGSAVYQFNQFIGTLIASFLTGGSISWLYYSDRITQFPLGVFAIAISTAVLPSLSTQAAQKETDQFLNTLNHALRLTFFIILPSMVGLIILGKPIIRLLFERGAFDANSTLMTYRALVFYATGLWAFSGIRVIVAGFYALQDTKTPVKMAIIAVISYMIFSLALMGPLKHAGLALALSLASSLQFILLIILFKRKLHVKGLRPVLVSAVKCSSAAAFMGVCLYYSSSIWFIFIPCNGLWNMITYLFCQIVIGLSIYFVSASVLGCSELQSVAEIFFPIFRKIIPYRKITAHRKG